MKNFSGKTVISLTIFLLLLFLLQTLAILDPGDFLALQSIRKSLSDAPGSSFFSSWDFTSDPCNFSGVLCSSDRVVSLSLGDPAAGSPGLAGRLDPAIGRLSALSILSLVPGRVSGPLPASLSRCRNLRFLALSRNYLSGAIPLSLSTLRRLRTLDLSSNRLSGPIPRRLGQIPALETLILSHNRLSGPIPPLISSSLARLDLSRNDLSGGVSDLALPSSLQYLSLSSNRLTGTVYRVLARLDRLAYLDLSSNRFNGSIPGSVFNLLMSSLQLQRNAFSGPILPVREVKIQTVDLSYNNLEGEISPLLSTAEILYLNHNRFVGQVPGSFVDHLMEGEIKVLYLQHNYLTGIRIDPTAEIPLSSSLCLQDNCMALPAQNSCPVRAGKRKRRPPAQCRKWRSRTGESGGAACFVARFCF